MTSINPNSYQGPIILACAKQDSNALESQKPNLIIMPKQGSDVDSFVGISKPNAPVMASMIKPKDVINGIGIATVLLQGLKELSEKGYDLYVFWSDKFGGSKESEPQGITTVLEPQYCSDEM